MAPFPFPQTPLCSYWSRAGAGSLVVACLVLGRRDRNKNRPGSPAPDVMEGQAVRDLHISSLDSVQRHPLLGPFSVTQLGS